MKKLCIVVPYRDREQHLSQFIPHMNVELKKQGIDFEILIVEQEEGKPFNRAKLLNIGFDHAKDHFDYFVFHDVDMLPVESDYSYCENPTHLAARAEQFGWKLPYDKYFGGVTLFDKESFLKINGYANEYWGWGAEDDDVFARCLFRGVKVSRKDCSFRSLHHERIIQHAEYHKNVDKLNTFQRNMQDGMKEGISTLKYEVLEEVTHAQYKNLKVRI
jgi:predicted glycosyltransferase involved in capsule biosynthesis